MLVIQIVLRAVHHLLLLFCTVSASTTKLSFAQPLVSSNTSSSTITSTNMTTHWIPVGLNNKVTKAEVLFALKLVASNYSFYII